METNQSSYSTSSLHHKYSVWLDRGVAIGEYLQCLSTRMVETS